jgi:gliding motility-associated-like protein
MDTIDLSAPDTLDAELAPSIFNGGVNISCAGLSDGSINAIITGGVSSYTFAWSGPNGFTSTDAALSALAEGTYCLVVTDTNGCSTQRCTTLMAPAALNAQASATSASCGGTNGAVDATISGGNAPYATSWDNSAQTEDLSNVPTGTYVLSVTDANGCTTSAQAVVNGSPALEAEGAVFSPLCHDAAGGSIDVTVNSGAAPFTFAWSNGLTQEDISGLPSGAYQLHITDANGCSWQEIFQVTAPEAIAIDTTLSYYPSGYPVSAYMAHDGSITITPSGGTAPYTILWSTGSTNVTVDGLPAGAYTVTVIDANGCAATLAIELEQPMDVMLPTGFTPNGDGQNDAYVVRGIEAYPNNELVVINRWGNVVYQQLNYRNTWRGENREGDLLPNGTYFVILRLDGAGNMQNYVDLRR